MPKIIHSGGQTGADRAALDWAIRHGVAHGGWCPKGRRAEDGPLADRYQLKETESAGYRQRTKRNIMDCDATLVVNLGELDGGTLETVKLAKRYGKPSLLLQLDEMALSDAANQLRAWLEAEQPQSLNIAGPREEKRPGVYNLTVALLELCRLRDEGEHAGIMIPNQNHQIGDGGFVFPAPPQYVSESGIQHLS